MRRQAKTSSQGKKKKKIILKKKNVQQFLVSPEVTLQEKPEIQEPKSRLFFFFFPYRSKDLIATGGRRCSISLSVLSAPKGKLA